MFFQLYKAFGAEKYECMDGELETEWKLLVISCFNTKKLILIDITYWQHCVRHREQKVHPLEKEYVDMALERNCSLLVRIIRNTQTHYADKWQSLSANL